MKKSDFNFDEIKGNVLKIKKDKQQLWFEIIYAVLPIIFFLLIVWLPFYTIRTATRFHFSLATFHIFFRLVFYTSWLAVFVLYLLSRVSTLKPFSFIVLELLYFALGIQQYSIHKAGFAGFAPVNLNVGFYFLLLQMMLFIFVAIMPKLVKKQIAKILTKKSATKAETIVEPPEELEKEQSKTEKEPEANHEEKEKNNQTKIEPEVNDVQEAKNDQIDNKIDDQEKIESTKNETNEATTPKEES